MRRITFLLVTFLAANLLHAGNNSISEPSKQNFYAVKSGIENMLNGKEPVSYERAIFFMENAYYKSAFDYNEFKTSLDFQTEIIKRIAEKYYDEKDFIYKSAPDVTPEMKKERYKNLLNNFAIFKYITDTVLFLGKGEIFYHKPFIYSNNDPYATADWKNSQVLNLLSSNSQQGNCFALASLFKIFAERLQTNAQLAVAPGHIFIMHDDLHGIPYNIELATKSFPGSGSIKAFTNTTHEAVVNGISMRTLDLHQAVAMCLVYLAKGYEHKFGIKEDDFMLQCAESALLYDSSNLNAMLLKAQVLEERVLQNNNDKTLYNDYERLLAELYKSGYREMTEEIRNIIIAKLKNENIPAGLIRDQTPEPFKNIKTDKTLYATLSNGLLDETNEDKASVQYGKTFFNVKTNRILKFVENTEIIDEVNFDPVVFAMSIDPLTSKYPELTPYQFASNRSIDGIDLDGLEYVSYKIYVDENNKVTKIEVTKDYELKKNGSDGPGIEYTIIGPNGMPGDYKFVSNYHGIYQGPNNPQLPIIGGDPNDVHDTYDLEPIDETDAIAKQHDIDYTKLKLKGLSGVLDKKSTNANYKYIENAKKTVEKQKNKDPDLVTGKPVTEETAKAAEFGIKWFGTAETIKKEPSPELKQKLIDCGPKD